MLLTPRTTEFNDHVDIDAGLLARTTPADQPINVNET